MVTMNKRQISKWIDDARSVCEQSGARLTEKRQDILKILLIAGGPLSAYQIANAYNDDAQKPMPTMSVYRILEFLETKDLVHKLISNSKYIACTHSHSGDKHKVTQFLICNQCKIAKEIIISTKIMDELGKVVENAGFALKHRQLELDCLCEECSA